MKNILVTTDFSQPAYNAVVFAAQLAQQAGARLILFHAYHPAILLEEETIWADPEVLEKEVQEKIDQLARELHKTYNISVTRVLKPGFAVDEILDVSKKVKADLLIIGTEGAGKRPKTGPGKICSEVLKKAELPVICLPPDIKINTFSGLINSRETHQTLGNAAGLTLFKESLDNPVLAAI
jgi:nucleotide-binding universal stress UspA family protein